MMTLAVVSCRPTTGMPRAAAPTPHTSREAWQAMGPGSQFQPHTRSSQFCGVAIEASQPHSTCPAPQARTPLLHCTHSSQFLGNAMGPGQPANCTAHMSRTTQAPPPLLHSTALTPRSSVGCRLAGSRATPARRAPWTSTPLLASQSARRRTGNHWRPAPAGSVAVKHRFMWHAMRYRRQFQNRGALLEKPLAASTCRKQ